MIEIIGSILYKKEMYTPYASFSLKKMGIGQYVNGKAYNEGSN